MKFTQRHHRAAKALANGASLSRAASESDVSEMSITRWKREPDFQQLVLKYSPAIQAAMTASGHSFIDLYELIPSKESHLIEGLEKMLQKLRRILSECLDEVNVADIPPRQIPNLIKSYCDALQLLQQSHDRVTGYELIARELGDIITAKESSQNGQN